MKKIASLMVIFVFLGIVAVYADAKDDWSFELATAIGNIESSINLIEKYGWSIGNADLDKKIKKYTELLDVGLRNGYLDKVQYDQKVEAVNAIKRRMLQIVGARSEGLGL
ncbi:hypothetical protein LQZ19_11455 [Treponema primitia]|uniref:hypothetical protein n=1 Tax=Treponema primitia TaxID=88058 RepID=UPI00397FAAD8